MQELGIQQENLTDLDENFGKDYDFSARDSSDAPMDFSTAPSKPHEHSGEGLAYSYTTNGPLRSVGETGDSGTGQKPFPPKMDARLFGGFRDPGNPFAAAFGQNRAFHQDHSSVGGLTAEDIDKARQAKAGSEQKPYKQMVCLFKLRILSTAVSVLDCTYSPPPVFPSFLPLPLFLFVDVKEGSVSAH